MQHPQFSDPGHCPAFSEDEQSAYTADVTHLIYTAEETSAADPSWTPVMKEALSVHAGLICNRFDSDVSLTSTVSHMLAKMAVITCADLPDCGRRRRSLYRKWPFTLDAQPCRGKHITLWELELYQSIWRQ